MDDSGVPYLLDGNLHLILIDFAESGGWKRQICTRFSHPCPVLALIGCIRITLSRSKKQLYDMLVYI